MKETKDVVFIFKAPSEEVTNQKDLYCEELDKRGFNTKTIPVLDFKYKNLNILKEKLLHPESYSGIIFTSPRCVRAVAKAINGSEGLIANWQELQTFAVGETTARLVKDNLKLSSDGSSAGNGATLAPIILKKKLDKPLLLPCGNLKMDSLENTLSNGGVSTVCVEVYETVPHPDLPSLLGAALAEFEPSHLVYFSPSGVHNTYPLLLQSGIHLEKIKWVSIGPTTAAALEALGLPVFCSAAKPNPQSLAEAITSAALETSH